MARSKVSTLTPTRSFCMAALLAILIICVWFAISDHCAKFSIRKHSFNAPVLKTMEEPADLTFYDDHETEYTIGKPIVDWDTKRTEWLKLHADFILGKENRVLVITGTQPTACSHPKGDHLLLRLFKNKVDYCRHQGYKIFYNNAHLDPIISSHWAKLPIVRAAMVAHPDVEWMFWVDSDAVFTDMEFKIPLDKYKDYNLVINGRTNFFSMKKRSWLAINSGAVLFRNCQWSMDFLEHWASFGPKNPDYTKWGKFLKSYFVDKVNSIASDQSVLTYFLYEERNKWGDKVYIENDYLLSGYWLFNVEKYDNITNKYLETESHVTALRRRHAEAVSASYDALRKQYVAGGDQKRWRRPFITHFTGCSPCDGQHNSIYSEDSCLVGLERTLNFADNQVLRNYGFIRPDIGNDLHIVPVPFDFPKAEILIEEFV